VVISVLRDSTCGYFFPAALACLGWPSKGFYLFLDKKVAKNQGLELMSDKIVKASGSAARAPDEKSGEDALPLVVVVRRIVVDALTFSPSIIS